MGQRKRTSSKLGLVRNVVLVELGRLLLGLLVVDGVGARCGSLSAFWEATVCLPALPLLCAQRGGFRALTSLSGRHLECV